MKENLDEIEVGREDIEGKLWGCFAYIFRDMLEQVSQGRDLRNKSYSFYSDKYGITLSTVYTAVCKIHKALREFFGEM